MTTKIIEWFEVTLVFEEAGQIKSERQGEFTKSQVEERWGVRVPRVRLGESREVSLSYLLDYLIIKKVESGVRL